MTTLSGSVDFTQTRNEIVTDALTLCGAIGEGETPGSAMNAAAVRQLERMIKHWQGQGIHIWSRRHAVLYVTPSQASYDLGTSSTDHATEESDAVRTTLGADASTGATSLTVSSITGIAASDEIGIVLDDDTFQWTTVSGSPTGTTVGLAASLTGAASSGNYVHSYTTDLARPLKIIDAQWRNEPDSLDIPVEMLSDEEYYSLPNKANTGETVEAYYHPKISSDLGKIYLWPVPNTVNRTLRLTCLMPLQDFDSSGNNADFPTEWLDCLVWNLAKRLLPNYGASGRASAQEIIQGGTTMLNEMLGWDQEPASVFFQPETRR